MRKDFLNGVDRRSMYRVGGVLLMIALSLLPNTSNSETLASALEQATTPVVPIIEDIGSVPIILKGSQLGQTQSTFWKDNLASGDSSPVPVQIGDGLVSVGLPFETEFFGEASKSCVDLNPSVQGDVIVGPVVNPADLHNQELFFRAKNGTEFGLGYCPVPQRLSNGEYYAVTPDVSTTLGNPNSICVTEGLGENK